VPPGDEHQPRFPGGAAMRGYSASLTSF
jgi:hypothetical protein